jgi:acyl-CoA thioester hydrolase
MIRHGPPPDSAIAIELEIPFHDVDLLEVAWHGHYCKYLELARTHLMRSRGLDAPDLRALGYRLYVAESHLRHVFPMRYAERLRVTAWFRGIENRLHVAYDLFNLTEGRRCGQASTLLVTTTSDGTLCLETPAPLVARLRSPGPGQAR